MINRIAHRVNKYAAKASDKASLFVRQLIGTKRGKVFGIGRNKTGTTSFQQGLAQIGYRVAPTHMGELLMDDWLTGNYKPIFRLCRAFDGFQDIPFSIAGSYEILDRAFPGSKFVLTIRDSEDQWFDSLVRFHSKIFGNGKQPTWEDLDSSRYCKPGFVSKCQREIYQAHEYGLYNSDHYKTVYLEQNQRARDYFANRPNDFLEINVAEPGAFRDLCQFLGVESTQTDFPWANKTS